MAFQIKKGVGSLPTLFFLLSIISFLTSACSSRMVSHHQKAVSASSWSFNWSDPKIRKQSSFLNLTEAQEKISKKIVSLIDSDSLEFRHIFSVKHARPLLVKVLSEEDFKAKYRSKKSHNFHAAFHKGSLLIRLNPKINWQSLRKRIRHEMVHVVVADSTMQTIPAWLDEGLAQYLEGGRHHQRANILRTNSNRPINLSLLQGNFSNLDSPQLSYAQSLFIVRHLVQKFGISKIKQMFLRLNKEKNFNVAFQKSYKLSLSSFEKNVNYQLLKWSKCQDCPL